MLNVKSMICTMKWMYHKLKGFKLSVILLTVLLSVVSLCNIAVAVVSKKLVDAATQGDRKFVYGLLFVYFIFVVSEIVVVSINSFLYANVWQNLSINIRVGLYRKLVNSYWLDFNKLHSGDYITRFTQDTAAFTNGIVDDIPILVSSIVKFTAAFLVLVYYQPMIALLTFAFGPIAFFITRFYSKKFKKIYKDMQKMDSEINSRLQEFFHNMQIVKVYGLEDVSSKTMEDIYKKRRGLVIKNSIINNLMQIISSIGSWGGYFLAFSTGILGIYTGKVSFGVLVVFLQLFNQIQQPLSGIAGSIPKMIVCLASAERIIEIEKLQADEFTDLCDIPINIAIRMDGISFSYPGRENQLNNINLIAENS